MASLTMQPFSHESTEDILWSDFASTDFTVNNAGKAPKPSPEGIPPTPTYIFLDQTNKASGKVDSPAVRKKIRSHFMLQVQKNKPQLLRESKRVAASRKFDTNSTVSDRSTRDISRIPSEHSAPPTPALSLNHLQRQRVENPCRSFNRATDSFAYAGGDVIDI